MQTCTKPDFPVQSLDSKIEACVQKKLKNLNNTKILHFPASEFHLKIIFM